MTAVSPAVSAARGATERARSTNNVAAVELPSSDATGQSCSSDTLRPSRLVASTFTVGERARMRSIKSAAASNTCSQLSNTNRCERPSNAEATLSATVIPGCCVIPRTAATASGMATGSLIDANSTTQTPSGKLPTSCAAVSSATRLAYPATGSEAVDENLAAVSGGHHPRRAVQHRTEVIVTALLGLARRDAHAHGQLQAPLCRDGGVDRGMRRSEDRADSIAGVLENPTAAAG